MLTGKPRVLLLFSTLIEYCLSLPSDDDDDDDDADTRRQQLLMTVAFLVSHKVRQSTSDGGLHNLSARNSDNDAERSKWKHSLRSREIKQTPTHLERKGRGNYTKTTGKLRQM